MAEHRNKNHGFHRFHPEKRQGFGHFATRRRLTAPMASQLLWAFAAAEVFHVPLLEALANHVVRRGGSGGGWGPQGMGGWGMAFLLWFLGWRDVTHLVLVIFWKAGDMGGSSQVKKDLPFMGIFFGCR